MEGLVRNQNIINGVLLREDLMVEYRFNSQETGRYYYRKFKILLLLISINEESHTFWTQ